ncbi:hypothetical protein [Larsenimonas rhizosphaerae]|uniref:Uncharacterized protein n=1 Tax=Larsenimonas rhizosphaerae TaxID=2944682 RepID=A0AA41ZHR7_9GAMM|nr:hypothetical protein [Larsenimonas rhizosphaerae]MCX2524073.1 hypothetical protein [Larsenimonas rhizosphaerae]
MIEMILGNLVNLIGPLQAMSRDHRELRDNALRSISHALNETCIYYRKLDSDRKRNFETENQLSRYWAAAAIPIRHIDYELSQICEHKSEYWINPEGWSPEELKQFNIDLDGVRKQYRQLLQPRFSRAIKKNA